MALNIAFIGFNRDQTRKYFEELYVANMDQTALIALSGGTLILRDGTIIHRIDSLTNCRGYRFDQIIIADDSRMNVLVERADEIAAIELGMLTSCVPEEFQRVFYNTDFKGVEIDQFKTGEE